MTRLTLLSFLLMTGFFYITGRPAGDAGDAGQIFAGRMDNFTGFSNQPVSRGREPLLSGPGKASGPQAVDMAASGRQGDAKSSAAAIRLPNRKPANHKPVRAVMELASANMVETSATLKPQAAVNPARQQSSRNKMPARSLAASYQQRFGKNVPPVLGPRLTAILIKRELRRVGCFDGTIDSSWSQPAMTAVERFNQEGGYNMPKDRPQAASLSLIKQISGQVCGKQPLVGRTIVASAQKVVDPVSLRKIKSSQWRSSARRVHRASYKPASRSRSHRRKSMRAASRNEEDFFLDDAPAVKKHPRRVNRALSIARWRARRRARIAQAQRRYRRKTAIRGWRRHYRRKRFRFHTIGGSFKLEF